MTTLPQIETYLDLLNKLRYDIERYGQNNSIYVLLDCIMTLNAIPEWIIKEETAPVQLKEIAIRKIEIMKGCGFELDENRLTPEIDDKLRCIRLICNHSKHKTDSNQIPTIKRTYGATLPVKLPANLYDIIVVGNKRVNAEALVRDVDNFWREQVENYS